MWQLLLRRPLTPWQCVKCEILNLLLTDEAFASWTANLAIK